MMINALSAAVSPNIALLPLTSSARKAKYHMRLCSFQMWLLVCGFSINKYFDNDSLRFCRTSSVIVPTFMVMYPRPTQPSMKLRLVIVLGSRHWSTGAVAAAPPLTSGIFSFGLPSLLFGSCSVKGMFKACSSPCRTCLMYFDFPNGSLVKPRHVASFRRTTEAGR